MLANGDFEKGGGRGIDGWTGTQWFELSDSANRFPIDGFGCEWDPKLLYYPNAERGVGQSDIDLIQKRIGLLNIHRVRVMVLPEWFEPHNDNDDPFEADMDKFLFEGDGAKNEMTSLWLYLDICERLGVKVTLTWWGAGNNTQNNWLAFPDCKEWLSAPNDLDEMAENISVFLQHALNEKKYTCIDSVILQNEPYYSFVVEGGKVDFEYYAKYYKTVHERLKADKLDGRVALVGSDDSDDFAWYKKSVEAISDYVAKFNSHCYRWTADDYKVGESIRNFVKRRVELTDKPFFLGEFGDGTTVGAYTTMSVDTYGRGLFLAVSAINSLKAGSTGSLYWPLHDVYYYSGDPNDGSNGGLMKMGLFAYKDDDNWRVRPTYHSWGLVCNYMLPGSVVYDVCSIGDDSGVIDAVAANTGDGKWTILIASRSEAKQEVSIKADRIGGELQLILYSEDTVTADDAMLVPFASVKPENGVYTFTMPKKSFAVLSNADKDPRPAASENESIKSQPPSNAGDDAGKPQSDGLPFAVLAAAGVAAVALACFFAIKNKKSRKGKKYEKHEKK